MNTNPNAKTVLCFGDSNTWGQTPQGDRLSVDKRWPGVLQTEIGEQFSVIEEGLPGRTIASDSAGNSEKNGKTFLPVCLATHRPLDLVILFLGTNDLKTSYNLSLDQIGNNLEELVRIAKSVEYGKNNIAPKILIVSPAVVKNIGEALDPRMVNVPETSKHLSSVFKAVSEKNGCAFLDAATIIESSDVDGYHLEASEHEKLGKAIAAKVNGILS